MVTLAKALRRQHTRVCIERDFFRPFELLLLLPGFYLNPNRWGCLTRLAFVVTRAVQLFQYALWADRWYLALTEASTDPGKALHYSNTFGVLSMMLARMLVFRWYMADVEQLKLYLRRQRVAAPPQTGSYRKIVNIAVIFQLIGLADRVVFMFSRTYRQELYEMPTNVTSLGWPAVLLVHILTFDFAWRWAAAYNVSLTGMNSIMLGLYDELSGIAEEYRHLLRDSDRRADFWTQLERNIARTVSRHERFLHQLNHLKPFLRTTFLMMFYAAALFLALGTFMISANGTTTYDVILSGFLVALLLECYWCCQLVDRLNDANEQIGGLLYGLDWPDRLRYSPQDAFHYWQARTALLIMMSKAQKSLGITCGGMFEMSREAFASLVKLTYTMLMFLRDTQRLN